MNKILKIISISILVLFILSIALIKTEANESQRAYFKVKNDLGKNVVKDIKRHEFKDNIVSVEASKTKIEDLKKNKNLEFIDYVYEYELLDSDINDDRVLKNFKFKINKIKDLIVRACKLSDYNLPQINYGIKYMYEDNILTETSGGKNVRVAVLDGGANIMHPDLINSVYYCKDVTRTNPENTCFDTSTNLNGHGTGVAAIIAADSGSDNIGMYGMAPEARLYIIKVCERSACAEDDIVKGVYDAVDNKVDIISMSLGGFRMSQVLKDALDYADSENTLLIAAAGNYFGYDNVNTILYPAAYYKVIAVGAINQDYTPWINSARGINDNDYIIEEREVEFGAPGTVILTAARNGCYTYAGGTSMATPHVSGLAAKIWDGNAFSTRIKLQNSAKLHDLYIQGDDTITGFGLPTINIPE